MQPAAWLESEARRIRRERWQTWLIEIGLGLVSIAAIGLLLWVCRIWQ
jgi:hypothetical protein